MEVTLNDVIRMTDSATFDRGRRYFNSGHVLSVLEDSEDEQELVFAKVSGSGRKPYTLEITRSNYGLQSLCSCPVGINCKHAVAALLKLIQQQQRLRPADRAVAQRTYNPLEAWLADLAESSGRPSPLLYGRHYLLYGLTCTPHGVEIKAYKAYLKKDGDWSQIAATPIDFSGYYYQAPNHVLPEDEAIAPLLQGLRQGGHIRLRGEEGGLALARMLATGRMILTEPARMLTRGPSLAAAMDWQDKGDHSQLSFTLPGVNQWQLIATVPPYYLDKDNQQLGQVIYPLPAADFIRLAAMPPVPKAEMPRISALLRSRFDREQLPLPAEPDIVVADTPEPHITLVASITEQGMRYPGLLLHWQYGDIAIPMDPDKRPEVTQVVEHQGKQHFIKRDLASERRHIDMLNQHQLYLVKDFEPWRNAWLCEGKTAHQLMHNWLQFEQSVIPTLEQQGWIVSRDPAYDLKLRHVTPDMSLRDKDRNWFDFSLNFVLDSMHFSTSVLVGEWLEQGGGDHIMLPVEDGTWLRVDTAPLQTIRDLIEELFNQKKLGKPVTLAAFQAARLQGTESLDTGRAPLAQKLIRQLKDFAGLEPVPVPPALNAQLRPYQQQGLDWLAFLQRYGFGGVLADDMGLGKTLQTLALILHMKESGKLRQPALVIAPTSLMGNWLREAASFAPGLKVTLIQGPQRDSQFKLIKKSDLVITSYPLLLRDDARYKNHTFSLLVLDEAQAIKNSQTKIAQQVRQLNAQTRLCLTGTPMENHLGELWALMDFALPGLLGSKEAFRNRFRQPIENNHDDLRKTELARRVAPFMLRRTKAEVVAELPEKTIIVQYVELEGKQRQLYESIRVSMEKRIRELIAAKGLARSHIEFLDALLKLRQACIDPRLVKLDKAANINEHAKLDWLEENLPQLLEEGRNILLFSQFTEALALIEDMVKHLKIPYVKLTGKTRHRDEAIEKFQSGAARLFLISLKAGGSGLNLTAADVVIHVDPWWNPAVENQATDRAHRIGQDKPVFVYKLVATNTVEERIQEMQQQKQALADALFSETSAAGLPTDSDSLLALLS